ncbi:hypothetical protein BKA93DRAFT_475680 [Sparassis latifolia]
MLVSFQSSSHLPALNTGRYWREQAMLLLALNDDVLAAVLSFAVPVDALQFGKTCRHAYTISIPQYLSDVTIKKHAQLSGFCAFMLAEPYRRPACVHAFHLGTLRPQRSDLLALSEVLLHAKSLESLRLDHLEDLLSEPSLGDALAALTCLDSISFSFLGKSCSALLPRMASRPRNIKLELFVDLNLQGCIPMQFC